MHKGKRDAEPFMVKPVAMIPWQGHAACCGKIQALIVTWDTEGPPNGMPRQPRAPAQLRRSRTQEGPDEGKGAYPLHRQIQPREKQRSPPHSSDKRPTLRLRTAPLHTNGGDLIQRRRYHLTVSVMTKTGAATTSIRPQSAQPSGTVCKACCRKGT